MVQNLEKTKMIQRICIILMIGMWLLLTLRYHQQMEIVQQEVAAQVLRLHVRANSDTTEDQQLKLYVRDQILSVLSPYRSEMTNPENSRRCLGMHMAEIENDVNDILASENIDTKIHMHLGTEWFPEKSYGDVTLPEGNYQALVAEVGSGQGKNWWCVIFPQLCYLENEKGVMDEDDKNQMKKLLSDQSWKVIYNPGAEVKFRCMEWFRQIIK